MMRMCVKWNIDLNQFGVFDNRKTDGQTDIGDCRVAFATKEEFQHKQRK